MLDLAALEDLGDLRWSSRSASSSPFPACSPKSEVATLAEVAPRTQISLGLDLAGGSQLLLEADLADAQKQRLPAMEDSGRDRTARAIRASRSATFRPPAAGVSFMVRDPTQLDAAVERLRTLTRPVGLTGTRIGTSAPSTATGSS